MVIPVGGGGLAAGVAMALRARRPGIRIVGVQAERCAPLAGGTQIGFTMAEGIAVKHPGALTAPLLAELLDDVVAVSEEEISETLVLLAERSKLVVEGPGRRRWPRCSAVAWAGRGRRLAILSGGNIDPTLLISVMRHGLTHAGRSLVLRSRVPDRPGELIKLLQLIAAERVNVVSVEHHREGMDIPIGETEVELTLLTRDPAHCDELVSLVEQWGYPVERVRYAPGHLSGAGPQDMLARARARPTALLRRLATRERALRPGRRRRRRHRPRLRVAGRPARVAGRRARCRRSRGHASHAAAGMLAPASELGESARRLRR